MEITEKQVKAITVIAPEGDIDASTAAALSEHISAQIARNNVKLVADFSAVDYTSSAGLRVLLGAVKETRRNQGDIRVTGLQPGVKKVFALSGFTSILKIYESVAEAVESFD